MEKAGPAVTSVSAGRWTASPLSQNGPPQFSPTPTELDSAELSNPGSAGANFAPRRTEMLRLACSCQLNISKEMRRNATLDEGG